MTVYDSYAHLIESIPWWPLVTCLALFIYRKEIKQLLGRIRKVGPQGFEVDPGTPQQSKPSSEQLDDLMSGNNLKPAYKDAINEAISKIKQQIAEDREQGRDDIEGRLIQAIASTKCALQAERAYRTIFSSQIEALSLLANLGGEGPMTALKDIYTETATANVEFYRNYSFDQWLNYLVIYELIELHGDNVQMTKLGMAFVPHIIDTGGTVTPNQF